MLFTSKSNTTTTTNATTNEANQETGNNNGGLLKGVAIAVGTVAGIGLAAFGGTKAYKHFHVKDENRLDDVTDNETPAENAEDTTNETTVENFNEVETEATENEAPAKAEKSVDETQADDKSSAETQTEETLTYTMSEKIQEAVQQSDETAATAAPEPESQAPMSPEASSLAAKLQEVGNLMRAEKWSDASEFYKTQLTPYLADDGLSKELRDEIMGIKTKATNMLMSQKQLEAKQKAASAKASKKGGKRRRH